MSKSTTLQINYDTSLAGKECSGVLFEIPTTEVIGGDVIDIRLWGMDFTMLAPYSLSLGTTTMGAGVNTTMPLGDITENITFLDTNVGLTIWSISTISAIQAVGNITWDNAGSVETYATNGTDLLANFTFTDNYIQEIADSQLTGSVSIIYKSSQDVQELIDFAETHKHQCEWPIQAIGSVKAVNEILEIDSATGAILSWAPKGADVTHLFVREGYSCLRVADDTDLFGSVVFQYTRAPYYKLWQWTVPVGAQGLYWFFIFKGGVPVNKFSIEMPDLTSGLPEPRNIAIIAVARDGGGALDNASVYIDGLYRGVTGSDGVITINGIMTGSHALKLTRDGFIDTDLDDLYNDELMVY